MNNKNLPNQPTLCDYRATLFIPQITKKIINVLSKANFVLHDFTENKRYKKAEYTIH
jgi:hypothetical protein